jgi:putative chitinase
MRKKYEVKTGDTLGTIAKKFLIEPMRIIDENNIKNPDKIRVGELLFIPEQPMDQSVQVKQSPLSVITIDEKQVQEILPHAKKKNIKKYAQALAQGLESVEINRPLRLAHFFAQIAIESSSLNATEESLMYSAERLEKVFRKHFPTLQIAKEYAGSPQKIANLIYANRLGNGDEKSGDGWRYRGRGLIQLTGKENYKVCGEAINQPLLSDPDIVSKDPHVSVMVCCWFWKLKNLNKYADRDDIKKITKKINGGYNEIKQREQALYQAKKILKI